MGHKMAGKNLLWHKRYDKSGKQYMARECRACSNQRYRINRKVKKKNRELDKASKARLEARLKEAGLSVDSPPKRKRKQTPARSDIDP